MNGPGPGEYTGDGGDHTHIQLNTVLHGQLTNVEDRLFYGFGKIGATKRNGNLPRTVKRRVYNLK